MLESLGLVPQSSNTKFVCTKEEDGEVIFIEIIRDDDEPQNESPNEGEGTITEGPAVEYFDTFPTRDELTYHKNEEDKRRGVDYVMSKILGFYKECLELGLEYVTGLDDEGEVTIPINLKCNMWESENLIEKPINWDKPPKNGDGAWHAKIRLIDLDGEEFTKTLQSIPTTRKLFKRESPREIIDLDHFYDT
ncbi:hypothetical protein Tco_0260113 [Tanacetum coccineum]